MKCGSVLFLPAHYKQHQPVFKLNFRSAQSQSASPLFFESRTSHLLCSEITIVLGQPVSLLTEACWYAGANWLSSTVSQMLARGQLTSWQEPHGSANLDTRRKQHYLSSDSRFNLHSPKVCYRCFRKRHSHVLLHQSTMVLGQSAGLSKEVCLYAGADW